MTRLLPLRVLIHTQRCITTNESASQTQITVNSKLRSPETPNCLTALVTSMELRRQLLLQSVSIGYQPLRSNCNLHRVGHLVLLLE